MTRAASGLLLVATFVAAAAPAAHALSIPLEPDRDFKAAGGWTRFIAFDGRECAEDGVAGGFGIEGTWLSADRLEIELVGRADCPGYVRTLWYTYELEGNATDGYSMRDPSGCPHVAVDPLPSDSDEAWPVLVRDPNDILGGCEIFEGVGFLAPESSPAGVR